MLRKVIVIDSTQNRSKREFEFDVTTFGDLKAELRKNGYTTDGRVFHEGISHTEYRRDDIVLPTSLPWKGVDTSDLIFMITKENKQIKSGSLRSELYSTIESLGIKQYILDTYGKNFTLCSNAILQEAIAANQKSPSKATVSKPKGKRGRPSKVTTETTTTTVIEGVTEGPVIEPVAEVPLSQLVVCIASINALVDSFTRLVDIFETEGYIDNEQRDDILFGLHSVVPPVDASDSDCDSEIDPYSDINWSEIIR